MKKCLIFCLLICVTACSFTPEPTIIAFEKGVSLELAKYRKATISGINYTLHLTIPEAKIEPIAAKMSSTFNLSDISQDLQLDFVSTEESVSHLQVNGIDQPVNLVAEHLVIDKAVLITGINKVDIRFMAGNTSLNRNPDYLYTIFVPDRARTAFPIFDQPNLKATYDLTLDLPKGWTSIANGPLKALQRSETRDTFVFEQSDLISSYLFTFVAGKFEVIKRNVDGVEMTLLHRETDEQKVARNVDEIFNLHKASLDWLENYTGIPYPFKKFDFALIPSFQFGGMEHVGAIHYRAESLFLDEDASEPRQLSRASLIAHETAHMWFGDLVTMDWFNDVWTKEVFANFVASKIINPSFSNVDHELNFLLRHYPSAYSVDRSEGANAIRQQLPNLNEAGTMYGAIIYNKAPIMMMQLEMLLGEEAFQKGLREYLQTYAFGNATWPDLVAILDRLSEHDLVAWSQVWVNSPGRPTISAAPHFGKQSTQAVLKIEQHDVSESGRIWPQRFSVAIGNTLSKELFVDIKDAVTELGIDHQPNSPNKILVNANGRGYGLFPVSIAMVTENWQQLSDVQKGSVFVALYEQLLESSSELSPTEFIHISLDALGAEQNQLLIRHMLARISQVYWTLLTSKTRVKLAARLENTLWQWMIENQDLSLKKMYYKAYAEVTLTDIGLERLKGIWSKTTIPEGLTLNERDYISLAADLAIKLPAQASTIVMSQLESIINPDRKRRFEFVMPALSKDEAVRDAFVESLGHEENRQIESWVLVALGYIHHPLRIGQSEKYISHGLALLEEIQVTGDIFFPGRWTSTILTNHSSDTAVSTVREFISIRPQYNYQLKLKILQAADHLFRANAIQSKHP
jgi:aminopeptidase N